MATSEEMAPSEDRGSLRPSTLTDCRTGETSKRSGAMLRPAFTAMLPAPERDLVRYRLPGQVIKEFPPVTVWHWNSRSKRSSNGSPVCAKGTSVMKVAGGELRVIV